MTNPIRRILAMSHYAAGRLASMGNPAFCQASNPP
jgi:hypothetical protein